MIQPEPRLLMVCWPLVIPARQRVCIVESECRLHGGVCACVLCPTRVPPEIKTCNFVVANVRSRVRPTIDEILYRAEAQAAVM